jgi:collagenase-like PrtC family protease
VHAALAVPGLEEIAVDFLEVKGLGDAIATIQAAGRRAVAVSPRVLKPSEERIRAFLLKLGADAILVRSLGLLESLLSEREREVPALYGDFSLNIANRRTLELLRSAGLTRLTPGHDLNAAQLCGLAEGPGAEQLELVLHHHLPIFHTEHCVFARFLSDGDNRSNCGAPCERHAVHLRGVDGRQHLVLADMGCRNTVFNSEAQSGLRSLERFQAAGYRRFRIELVDHRPEEVAPLVSVYQRALAGQISGREAWRELRERSRFGLTVGSLKVVQEQEQLKTPGWTTRY